MTRALAAVQWLARSVITTKLPAHPVSEMTRLVRDGVVCEPPRGATSP
jgi:hypothetical protein